MIFLSKNEPTRRSGRDACSSAVALFIAIGIIAGLAGLIFGKRKKQDFFSLHYSSFRFSDKSFSCNDCWWSCPWCFGVFNFTIPSYFGNVP